MSDLAVRDNPEELRYEALRGGTPGQGRPSMRTAVLVEGISDQRAVEVLARRRGLDLDDAGVEVVPIGGAQAIRSSLERFGPHGLGLRLAGLCDAGEEAHFRRALEEAGLGADLTRADMEALGFFVCVADLEDELIRVLGPARVEEIVESEGDIGAFRTLQKQPEWRGRDPHDQLRRFMGSGGSRKIRYASLLVDALDLAHVPRPLDGVVTHVGAPGPGLPRPGAKDRLPTGDGEPGAARGSSRR